jgi:hypothetical protein
VAPDPRSLAALGLTRDPIAYPLTYPGRLPAESGLLDGDRFLALRERTGASPGGWAVDDATTLDDMLRSRGAPPLADRHPILAVGSNGSPAQLRRKLAGRASVLLPLTYATVRGLVSGVSAHVSRPGYVPAAPVRVDGATGRLVVLWPDDAQLSVIDATEPNYHRLPLPGTVTVSLDGDAPLAGCRLYAGRHGCLVDRNGGPFHLTGQAELVAGLLADLPVLGRLIGARDSGEFAARLRRDPELRERVRLLWRREGRVLEQPELGRKETSC